MYEDFKETSYFWIVEANIYVCTFKYKLVYDVIDNNSY